MLQTLCLEDQISEPDPAVRSEQELLRVVRINRGMFRLVQAVQELSLARDLNGIMAIVRRAAREIAGSDGSTFVLRDGDLCHYADEDAIAPLWKGQRFPMKACISGWAMLNRQPVVIEDIYADSRIPADAYRPTFVQSLAMVPIRTEAPIGAIGNYWAKRIVPDSEAVELLQALANTTAVAMENVRVHDELEQRVRDRTAALRSANAELEVANRELESFSYAVSHDLGAPVRRIRAFCEMIAKECGGTLPRQGLEYLTYVRDSATRMRELIDDLLTLSRVTRSDLRRQSVDLSELARAVLKQLASHAPDRSVDVRVAEGILAEGDRGLLRIVLENLLSNAWKYTSKSERARIEFETLSPPEGPPVYCVSDNGAGFGMEHASKLFQPFQRLHSREEFPGSGVGLATVQRIIVRHGGRIWAEADVGRGAKFYFTLAS